MYDADEHLWKAWWSTVVFSDCSQVTTDRELDIKYAESDDGLAWRIQAEPALRSHRDPGDWDYSTTETPTVIKVGGAAPERRYALIYAGGNDNVLKVLGQTGWQLGVAFSADGKQFQRISAAESPYARGPDGLARLYYSGWGTKAKPAGSCVYVYDRTGAMPALVTVPGTANLLLAVRR